MKLKTNKLLTLTLASSLVAITAGCGGTKAAAPKGGTDDKTPVVVDTVTYSDWSGSATIATVVTDNAFLAGTAAVAAAGTTAAVDANLTGLPTGTNATILTLAYEVTAESDTSGATKGLNAETLGGAETNAVGFATTGTTTTSRYFAGLIAGADLGVPLTTTTAAGVWNGIFQAVGANAVEKEFVLTVNFADSEISGIVPVGADTFATDATSYYISGSYDAAGVITGNVLYRGFATATANTAPLVLTAAGTALTDATADDAEDSDTVGLATLSGLIGTDGALGAFYSSGSDGQTATGFAGGFVATTADNAGGDDPDVVYADWSGSATLVTSATVANGFVAGDEDGLGIAALTGLSTLNLAEEVTPAVNGTAGADGTPTAPTGVAGTAGTAGARLGGDAINGVAFGSNGTSAAQRFFAGLHETTDLGAPIAAAADRTGDWAGLFQAVGADGYATAARAITLTVTFSATADDTIVAIVPADDNTDTFTTAGDESYYISGTYDANGVITGNVLYRDFATGNANAGAALAAAGTAFTAATADGATGDALAGRGVLSGLIGQDGAVGAFYSDADGATGYAGGFVASTDGNAVIDATAGATGANYVINYARWVPASPALVASATTTATAPTASAFVHGTGAALALPSSITGTVALNLSSGALTGDAMDGVAFVTTGSTAIFHAGLHSTTDLGAPLTDATAGGAWTGLFQAVGAADYTTAAKAFTLTVNFGTTSFNAHVAAGAVGVTDASATDVNSYYLAGTFVAATGLMTGTIIHGDYSAAADADAARTAAATALGVAATSTSGHGTVTGLIGQGGAVGAFISAQGGAIGYAGGFVANNP